jgi:hypothetical protein
MRGIKGVKLMSENQGGSETKESAGQGKGKGAPQKEGQEWVVS